MSSLSPLWSKMRQLLARMANDSRSDSELLDLHRQGGDPLAFEILYARHSAAIWRCCQQILGPDDDAVADVFQTVWVIFSRKAGDIQDGQALLAWLLVVCRRASWRRANRAQRTESPMSAPRNVPETAIDPARRAEIRDEIASLPERQRDVISLVYLEGQSIEETAQTLGISVATVRRRLTVALECLRQRFEVEGQPPAAVPPIPPELWVGTLEAVLRSAAVPLGELGLRQGALELARWLLRGTMVAVLVCGGAIGVVLLAVATTLAVGAFGTPPAPTPREPAGLKAPEEQATLGERVLAEFDEQVEPDLERALKKVVIGGGNVVLRSRIMTDRHLIATFDLQHRDSPFAQLGRMRFRYDMASRWVEIEQDYFGRGEYRRIVPHRSVMVGARELPVLGDLPWIEFRFPLKPVQECETAFDRLPMPFEWAHERTLAWQRAHRPEGLWAIPGPVRCLALSEEAAFVQTADSWMWWYDRRQPVPDWVCIGMSPAEASVSLVGDRLVGENCWRFISRPASGRLERWDMVQENTWYTLETRCDSEWVLVMPTPNRYGVRRWKDPVMGWQTVEGLGTLEAFVSGGKLYGASADRKLWRWSLPEKAGLREPLGELGPNGRLIEVFNGRLYSLDGKESVRLLSRPAEPGGEWRVEGEVVAVP